MSNSFDKHIANKLENIQVKYHEKYWSSFESKLIDEGLLNEDQAQNQLAGMTNSKYTDRSNWSAFASKLEAFENNEFDTAVRNKLANKTYVYDEKSWEALYQKLAERDRKDKLIFYRLSRVAAVLIFLLLSATAVVQINNNKINREWMANYWDNQQSTNFILFDKKDKQEDLSLTSDVTSQESNTPQSKQSTSAKAEINARQDTPLKNLSTIISRIFKDDHEVEQLPKMAAEVIAQRPEQHEYIQNVNFIETATPDLLRYATEEPNLEPIVQNNRVQTTLAIYPAYEMSIVTPENGNLGQEAVVSRGMGASVAFQKGAVGVNLGAKYQKLEYDNPHSVDNNKLDFVNVPVEFQYTPVNTESTNLYAIAGVEGHFAILSEYSVPTVGRSANNQGTFRDGLAQNGGFNNNAYATANVGFGVKQKVSDHIDLFGELKYKSAITNVNIGPGDDIRFGIEFKVGASIALN